MSVRRKIVAALSAVSLLGVGLVSGSAALAAQALEVPATPTTEIGSVKATTAKLKGELNPGAGTAESSYHFLYTPGTSATACEGTAAPEPAGTGKGNHHAVGPQELTGLQPNTEYAFCLQAFNETETLSSAVATFKTPAVKPTVGTQSVSGITPFDAVLEAVVDPNYDETTTTFEYATNEALTANLEEVTGPTINGGEQPTSVDLGGKLAPSTTYYFRVATSNSAGDAAGTPVQQFTTLPEEAPALSEETISEAKSTGVLVHGQINPNSEETTYEAKCGPGEHSFNTATAHPGPGPLAAGFGNQAVTVTVTGLSPNTEYSCWLVASNKKGETVGATELVFHTKAEPIVTTGASSDFTRTTAVLAGTVDPAGASTEYHFVYGTTTAYGHSTSAVAVGEGFANVAAGASLEELTPGTTYHYALVATNSYGTAVGAVNTFETSPPAPPAASTGGTTGVGHETAILTGTVEPDGLQTTYEFQLGTEAGVYYTQGYGSILGAGAQSVSIELQDLAPGVTYHYRIVATNQDGSSYGSDQTFATAGYSNPLAAVPVSPPLIVVAPEAGAPKVTTITRPTKPKKTTKHKKKSKKKTKKSSKQKG